MVNLPSIKRKPWGIIVLVMNIFLPGSGTMIAAGNMEETRLFVHGLLQALLSIFLVGILWSWIWGVLLFIKSR